MRRSMVESRPQGAGRSRSRTGPNRRSGLRMRPAGAARYGAWQATEDGNPPAPVCRLHERLLRDPI
jgi:hypothetical protein